LVRNIVVLLRHGRTDWNAQRRFQGQEDIPLDALGLEQAQTAALALARHTPALVLSSDLDRAAQTAAPLAAALGLDVHLDPRLREVDLGTWQGLDDVEAQRAHPDEHVRWRQGEDVRRGGGETYVEVAARAVAAIEEALADLGPEQALVTVTHGGTARAVVASLLELPYPRWSVIGPLGNGCWSTLVHLDTPDGEGRWRLLQHNVGAEPGGVR
jgi:broad specificity phosphatase PhoE